MHEIRNQVHLIQGSCERPKNSAVRIIIRSASTMPVKAPIRFWPACMAVSVRLTRSSGVVKVQSM